jgi:site-specific recombinase XerD
MQIIKWEHYPHVAQNKDTRTFIEELAQVQKSPSTLDNYSRDLEDFLQAVAAISWDSVLEADETLIAHYVDGLWSRPARRGSGHQTSRDKITYATGSKLALNTIRRRLSTIRVFFDWCIRVHHRQSPLNPVPKGVRGKKQGLIRYAPSAPWIPSENQFADLLLYVFARMSLRNQALILWAVTKIFDEIRDALGLPQLTPHKLRHLMLTHLMDYGLDLYEVSLYARHRSTASTEIYLHVADAKLARQLNHIQEQQWQPLIDWFSLSRASISAFACLLRLLIILIAPLRLPSRNVGASPHCSN